MVCLALIVGIVVPAGNADGITAPVGPPSIPGTGLLFGGFATKTAAGQTAAQAVAGLEAQAGRTMAIDRSYSLWDDVQPSTMVLDDAAHGRVPLLSIKPQRSAGSAISWSAVASGSHDAEIRTQADALRDSGVPLILTFHHEPEYASGYGSATDYVAAFRHYVAVFRAEQATNVAFTVVLGASTYTNPTPWYPGDDVVDWVGADAYNFGACTPSMPAWRSLAQAAGAFYQWGSARGKPLLLAEWGSAEDPLSPGRKAAWLRDAATTLAGWPQLKAAAYFNRIGSCDWRIDTSASALAAFQDDAHLPLANAAPSARLVPATAVDTAPLSETFDLSTSTGSGSATGTGVASWTLDFGDGSAPAGGIGQPVAVEHTYAAGHWTAALTIIDAAQRQATTSAAVIAAVPPSVSDGSASAVTATTAILPAWISTNSLVGSYYVQWGTSTNYGSRSSTGSLPALGYSQAITYTVTGLSAATHYHWRVVASNAAGTTAGPDRVFTTQ